MKNSYKYNMKKSKNEKINIELEMIHELIQEMNLSQLEKLSFYACKLLNDKRYKNENEI
jgi:hypothetical protein